MSTESTPNLSKSLGALLGVHTGDSLGATLEFMSFDEIKKIYPTGLHEIIGGGAFDWPPGHATDDTDLTRAVLLAYRDRHALLQSPPSKRRLKTQAQKNADVEKAQKIQDFDIVTTAAKYAVKWLCGDWPSRKFGSEPEDIGGATERGLTKFIETKDARNAGAGRGSAGNGSLMRCIPTALFTFTLEERVSESMEISAITHDDERCTVACAVYNEMVAALVEGKSARDAVETGIDIARDFDREDVEQAILLGQTISIEEMAQSGPGEDFPDGTSGYVLQTLSIAVGAVLDPRGFEEVLIDVTRIGGDTDTNGAIAGGLLGARDGIESIPKKWLEKLQFAEEFEKIARELLEEEIE